MLRDRFHQFKCRYCSKWHPREYFVAGPVIGLCLDCYAWHCHAINMLAGEIPPGCQECGLTKVQLAERALTDETVTMFIHPKDGIYQILCRACSDAYEKKRLDLYANTPHGWAKKLKGAK